MKNFLEYIQTKALFETAIQGNMIVSKLYEYAKQIENFMNTPMVDQKSRLRILLHQIEQLFSQGLPTWQGFYATEIANRLTYSLKNLAYQIDHAESHSVSSQNDNVKVGLSGEGDSIEIKHLIHSINNAVETHTKQFGSGN